VIFIEKAYRGLLEEQYANIVWLSQSVARMGCRASIVLQGYAVYHAMAAEDHAGVLPLAGATLESVGDYRVAIRAALGAGLRIYVSSVDWSRLIPIGACRHPSIFAISDRDLAELVMASDQAWYW